MKNIYEFSMMTRGGSSLTLTGFLCVYAVAPGAEVSVTKYNSVLFRWPVPGSGQFVGQFVYTKFV